MVLKLFFSWQSDTDSKKLQHTRFIRECIHIAIRNVNKELKYVEIKYQEGISGVPGSPELISEIEMRIKEAHIFVGDLTFINKETFFTKKWKKLRGIKYKVTPNPNVINESALFIGRGYTKYQAIHVLNTKFGDPNKDVNLIFADKRDKRFPLTFRLDEYNDKTPKNNYDKEQKN